jgi:hypothetical protein
VLSARGFDTFDAEDIEKHVKNYLERNTSVERSTAIEDALRSYPFEISDACARHGVYVHNRVQEDYSAASEASETLQRLHREMDEEALEVIREWFTSLAIYRLSNTDLNEQEVQMLMEQGEERVKRIRSQYIEAGEPN